MPRQPIAVDGLAKLFAAYAGRVRLIVLNACYSDALAEALIEHVDVVIGMPHTIDDDAAILFAPTFYQQLAGGQSIQTAYEVARALLLGLAPHGAGAARRDVEPPGMPAADWLPRRRARPGVDAAQLRASALPDVPAPPVEPVPPPWRCRRERVVLWICLPDGVDGVAPAAGRGRSPARSHTRTSCTSAIARRCGPRAGGTRRDDRRLLEASYHSRPICDLIDSPRS
jgi:hypothetical protein